jgi:hypothetical protein
MPNDILLDGDFDLAFVDGDFAIGESTRQHQNLILISEPGEWREFPTVGVGIRSKLLGDNPGEVVSEIKRQFEGDGMRVTTVRGRISPDGQAKIDTDAFYP